MADGTIIINTEIDSTQAQKELNALTKKISGLSEKLNDLEREKLPLVEQSDQLAANLNVALATLEHMKSGEEFFTSDSIADQQARVKSLQKEFDASVAKLETIDLKINKTAAKACIVTADCWVKFVAHNVAHAEQFTTTWHNFAQRFTLQVARIGR